ncbi:hypothetical protein ACQ4M3_19215 [Leptolyngbya sp. AN03gr2]|uniref:hypothetical protein n=1 Tax=Leptolyngbya sp. AN03gr2 TaxID=3423364 RepID=UPI003D31B43C
MSETLTMNYAMRLTAEQCETLKTALEKFGFHQPEHRAAVEFLSPKIVPGMVSGTAVDWGYIEASLVKMHPYGTPRPISVAILLDQIREMKSEMDDLVWD